LYLVVGVVARKRGRVSIALCAQHRRARRLVIVFGWFCLLLAIAALSSAINSEPGEGAAPVLLALVLVVISAIVGTVGTRVVYPVRIDAEEIRLKGFGRKFLDSL
jgi:peptidoglycan/LPS O-acetylase OafA/YrhL